MRQRSLDRPAHLRARIPAGAHALSAALRAISTQSPNQPHCRPIARVRATARFFHGSTPSGGRPRAASYGAEEISLSRDPVGRLSGRDHPRARSHSPSARPAEGIFPRSRAFACCPAAERMPRSRRQAARWPRRRGHRPGAWLHRGDRAGREHAPTRDRGRAGPTCRRSRAWARSDCDAARSSSAQRAARRVDRGRAPDQRGNLGARDVRRHGGVVLGASDSGWTRDARGAPS